MARDYLDQVRAVQPSGPYHLLGWSFGGVLAERDMWGVTPLDQLWCRIRFRSLRYDGEATPPETMIFTWSQPCRICSRIASSSASTACNSSREA